MPAGAALREQAQPGLLTIHPAVGKHSADSDGEISLAELTRVIELCNARSGGARTSPYHVQAGTEDEFEPGS